MTPDQQYNQATYLATDMARLIKGEDEIIDWAYAPFQLLYVEMVTRKEIPALRDLPVEQKEKYWDKVKNLSCPMYKKIWCCQALYTYFLITNQ